MRQAIVGGLMAAGLIGGAGYAGHELAEILNNDPMGAQAGEEAALAVAQEEYLDAAPEGSCEQVALGAIATASYNWNELPKSEQDTLAALNGACQSGSADGEHEKIAATASVRFSAVDKAQTDYDNALDAQEFTIEERLTGIGLGEAVLVTGYFMLLCAATLKDHIKARRNDPMRDQRKFEHA